MPASQLVDTDAIPAEVWSRLRHAADAEDHPMRLVTLATAGADGRPSARIMVLRGVDEPTHRVWFYTDRRSPKAADIVANPAVCLVAYDPRDGVEIRLSGAARLLDAGAETEAHWSQVSLTLQALYAFDLSPDADAEAAPDVLFPRTVPAATSALTRRARANFAVIEVGVETIDWLQVRKDRQRRRTLRVGAAEGPGEPDPPRAESRRPPTPARRARRQA